MEARVLGIDLSDISTDLIFYPHEEGLRFPTVICKEKDSERWTVGEEAYDLALKGRGVITDKLVNLAKRRGTSTLNGVKYQGRDLLKLFLKEVLEQGMEKQGGSFPQEVVLSVPNIDNATVDEVKYCFRELGYSPSHVHVISREESFVYYVLSQKKEYWNNQVGLFDLSDISLTYYEMKAVKKSKGYLVTAESEAMNEAFNLDILNTPSGAKMADRILKSAAQNVLGKKVFSSIILTGKAFEAQQWAGEFLDFIGKRRRIFHDIDLFAKGAAFRGMDLLSQKPLYNITCVCQGRLPATLSVDLISEGKLSRVELARLGDPWYQIKHDLRVIPDGLEELTFFVTPLEGRKKREITIPLNFLPDRPSKTRRIDLRIRFLNESLLQIKIRDAGFGDLYKVRDLEREFEVSLWG